MKKNNPRKNREAKAAAALAGIEAKPAAQAAASELAATSEAAADVAQQGAIAGKVAQQSGAIGAAAEQGAAANVASQLIDASQPTEAAAAAQPDGNTQPTGADQQPDASQPQPEDAETVSFTSATEMLAQSQQEIKKAKAAVARQKRAKEMEAFQKKVHAKRVRRRIFLIIFGLVLLAVLALVVAFCANRWWLHDDAADIQGTWQVDGSDATVTFTEDSIVLTDEVAYRYEIDPETKVIKFNFGNLSGEGSYRFSLDRNQLSVTDGETNAAGDIMEDIGWWINAMIAQVRGYQLPPTIDADSVAFERK